MEIVLTLSRRMIALQLQAYSKVTTQLATISDCPQPSGACCGSDWCLDLTDEECTAVGGQWTDAQTTCDDGFTCENDCPEDLNGDGVVDVSDLLQIVGDWASQDSNSDIDGSGVVDTGDLLAVIASWGQCE